MVWCMGMVCMAQVYTTRPGGVCIQHNRKHATSSSTINSRAHTHKSSKTPSALHPTTSPRHKRVARAQQMIHYCFERGMWVLHRDLIGISRRVRKGRRHPLVWVVLVVARACAGVRTRLRVTALPAESPRQRPVRAGSWGRAGRK